MKKLVKFSALAVAIAAVAACDVAPQDGGTNQSKKFSGTVIDGKVAGGKVWVDRNDNDKWDDFEPYAYTDEDGVYSYNARTERDYCSPAVADNVATNFRNCLTVFTTEDSFKIKVKGGIDTTTGEELKGIMSMDEAFEDGEVEIATTTAKKVLSPITTLLANTPAESKQAVRTALGITDDADLKVDYTSDTSKRELFATAVAAQTVLATVANASIAATANAGSSDYEAAQKSAASALVSALTGGTKLTDMNAETLQSVASSAATSFASTKSSTVDTAKVTQAAARVAVAVSTLKTAAAATETTAASFAATLKVSETISKLAEKEAKGEVAATVLDSLSLTALQAELESAETATSSVDLNSVVNGLASGGSLTDAVNSAKVDTTESTDLDSFYVFRYMDKDTLEVLDAFIALKLGKTRSSKDAQVCAGGIDEETGDRVSLSLTGDFLSVNGTYILNTLYAGTIDVDLVMKKPVLAEGAQLYSLNGSPMTPFIFKPGEALLQAAEDNDVDLSEFTENTVYAQTGANLSVDDWNQLPLATKEDCETFVAGFDPTGGVAELYEENATAVEGGWTLPFGNEELHEWTWDGFTRPANIGTIGWYSPSYAPLGIKASFDRGAWVASNYSSASIRFPRYLAMVAKVEAKQLFDIDTVVSELFSDTETSNIYAWYEGADGSKLYFVDKWKNLYVPNVAPNFVE